MGQIGREANFVPYAIHQIVLVVTSRSTIDF